MTNHDTQTQGIDREDTVLVSVEVPSTVLSELAADGELTTDQDMKAALRFWADLSAENRRSLYRAQIRDGGDG